MSDDALEPFVILERPSPRRWTVLRGRKPALLLVDRGGPDGFGLDLPLASEGFDVYRTAGRASALDLLEVHASVLMALVRTDLPDLDAAELVRDLRRVRPGLWVGLLCDPADRDRAAAGYAAGAADLFSPSADPGATIARLVRAVPRAARNLVEAEERLERRRRREATPWHRRMARRATSRLRGMSAVALALLLGAGLAVLTRSWQESAERDNARIERVLGALDGLRPPVDRADRLIDRWQRQEEIDLQRRSQESLGEYHRAQLEEDRLRELLRLSVPRYQAR